MSLLWKELGAFMLHVAEPGQTGAVTLQGSTAATWAHIHSLGSQNEETKAGWLEASSPVAEGLTKQTLLLRCFPASGRDPSIT